MNVSIVSMKRLFLFSLMIVLLMTTEAQDTIIFRNGDVKSVKITEVSKTQIKYLRWNSQDGPVYVQDVCDIYMVKYHDGTKDVYEDTQYLNQSKLQEEHIEHPTVSRLTLHRSSLFLDGKLLSYRTVRRTLSPELYQTYVSASRQKGRGTIFGVLSLVTGIGGVGCLLGGSEVGNLNAGYCMLGLSDIFLAICIVDKSVGRGRLNWVVDEYNRNQRQLSQDFSVSISPTLVCVPTATGNSYRFGAGMQLHF